MNRLLATTAVLILAASPLAMAQTQGGTGQQPTMQNQSGQTTSGQSQKGTNTTGSGMSSGQSSNKSTSGSGTSTTGKSGMSQSDMSQSGMAQPSHDQTRQAQDELKQAGLYKGQVDGIYGPQTRSAIEEYQKSKNLPTTGKLDKQTMNSLHGSGTSTQ